MNEEFDNLTKDKFRLARRIERSGQASYPQIVRAYERGDFAQIKEWESRLPPSRYIITSRAESVEQEEKIE
jgi:hypothetical protein